MYRETFDFVGKILIGLIFEFSKEPSTSIVILLDIFLLKKYKRRGNLK
jgi:hypothetical protein